MRSWPRLAGARARVGLGCAALMAAAALASSQGFSLRDYREGEDLYERGDLAAALRAFEAAYAADPRSHRGERIGMHFEDYDPAFQIGRIHARLGNFEQAQRYFAQCAASGYTERSQNAAEYARWRAVVERAVALAKPALAKSPGAPAAVSTPPSEPPPASKVATPAATAPPVVERRLVPTAPAPVETAPVPIARVENAPAPTAPPFASRPAATALPAAAIEPQVSPPRPREAKRPPSAPERRPLDRAPVGAPRAAGGGSSASLAILAAAVLLVLLAGAALARQSARRFAVREPVATVDFGRYAISGFLGGGPGSFVYEARDRKSRAAVALKLARPDAPPEIAERFRREADALERLRLKDSDAPGPRLLERGAGRAGGRRIEYVAVEKLSGRTLLDFSRNSRRRFDASLSIEILLAIADRLDQARAIGLAHERLTAEDVFLIDPIPLTAGRGIELKILGLTPGEQDAKEARALAAVALELFRGRGRSWENELSIPEHVPERLRELLRHAAEGRAPTIEELRAALDAGRGPSVGAAEA